MLTQTLHLEAPPSLCSLIQSPLPPPVLKRSAALSNFCPTHPKSQSPSCSHRALQDPFFYLPALISPHFPPCSLGFNHGGLHVAQTHQVHSSLRTFAHPAPSTWNLLARDIHVAGSLSFRSVLKHCLLREVFPDHSPLY